MCYRSAMTCRRNTMALGAAWLILSSGAAVSEEKIGPELSASTECVWAIVMTVQQFGRLCFPDRREESLIAIDEAVEAIERSFVAEGRMTEAKIREAHNLTATSIQTLRPKDHPPLCEPPSESGKRNELLLLYEHFRKQPPDVIGDMVKSLLATPRDKMHGACL